MAGIALLAATLGLYGAESWTMGDCSAWSREAGAVKLATTHGGFEVRHTESADWCVNGFPRIAVKYGDTFELTCETKALSDVPDSRPVCLNAVLRDAQGGVVAWTYASAGARPGKPIRTAFMVPDGVATIQPRVTGNGLCGAHVSNVRVVRTGNALPKGLPARTCVFENDSLSGGVDPSGFNVTDKRTGRT